MIHQSTKNQELQIVRYPHPLRSMSRGLFHTNTPANFHLDKNPEKLYIFSKTAWSKLLFRRHFLFVKVILSLTMCKARRGERWSHLRLGLLAPSLAVSRKNAIGSYRQFHFHFDNNENWQSLERKRKLLPIWFFSTKVNKSWGCYATHNHHFTSARARKAVKSSLKISSLYRGLCSASLIKLHVILESHNKPRLHVKVKALAGWKKVTFNTFVNLYQRHHIVYEVSLPAFNIVGGRDVINWCWSIKREDAE